MDTKTNHDADIEQLRKAAGVGREQNKDIAAITLELAADLLELHDDTGISLDNWPSARAFVEHFIHHPITENRA